MSGGKEWFSKEEVEKAMKEAELEKERTQLSKRPRREVELTPEEKARKLVVKDASSLWDVPPGFITIFVDPKTGAMSPYIGKAGLLYKLGQKGYRSVQTEVAKHPDIEGGFLATASIYPQVSDKDRELLLKIAEKGDKDWFNEVFRELTRPIIAHGTAHPGNIKTDRVGPFIYEIAETRALLRAVRVYTGMGLAVEGDEEEA